MMWLHGIEVSKGEGRERGSRGRHWECHNYNLERLDRARGEDIVKTGGGVAVYILSYSATNYQHSKCSVEMYKSKCVKKRFFTCVVLIETNEVQE